MTKRIFGFALVALLFAACLFTQPSTAHAAGRPPLSGAWGLQLSNDGKHVYRGTMQISEGNRSFGSSPLTGTVQWDNGMTGQLEGTSSGYNLTFTVRYSNGVVGTYHAVVQSGGDYIDGQEAHDNYGNHPQWWNATRY